MAPALPRPRQRLVRGGVRYAAQKPTRSRRSSREWESAQRVAERSIGESPDDPTLRILLAIAHAEVGSIPRLLTELGLSVRDVGQDGW